MDGWRFTIDTDSLRIKQGAVAALIRWYPPNGLARGAAWAVATCKNGQGRISMRGWDEQTKRYNHVDSELYWFADGERVYDLIALKLCASLPHHISGSSQ